MIGTRGSHIKMIVKYNLLISKSLMQAILPLRGKILNIERKDEASMYKNEEIQNLILALGLGVKVLVLFFLFLISEGIISFS